MTTPPRVSHANQPLMSEFRARHLEDQLNRPRYFQIDELDGVSPPAITMLAAVTTTLQTSRTYTAPAALIDTADIADVREKVNDVIRGLGPLGANVGTDLVTLTANISTLEENVQLVAVKLNELLRKLDSAGLVDVG